MNLKTYHAYTMAEALAGVKRDLGADAVILNTRTFKRGGLLGLGKRTIVEVTATPAKSQQGASGSKKAANAPAQAKPKSLAAQRAYATKPSATAASSSTGAKSATIDDDRLRTQRLAMAMEEAHSRSTGANSASPSQSNQSRTAASAQAKTAQPNYAQSRQSSNTQVMIDPKPASRPSAAARAAIVNTQTAISAPITGTPIAPAAKRFLLTSTSSEKSGRSGSAVELSEDKSQLTSSRAAKSIVSIGASSSGGGSAGGGDSSRNIERITPAMEDDLATIKTMVSQVLERQASSPQPASMPPLLHEMYLRLVNQDISSDLADLIINEVRDELDELELQDAQAVRETVVRSLARLIPVAENPLPEHTPDGRPLTLALIGPTGVGKTTTLAKLAASFKLRHKRKVGMITSDTYRIAAVDQLRTYADIIGIPLKVALTPDEMQQAMDSLRDCDAILIDTAGRSQNDSGRLADLKRFIAAAAPHEVHLVLSSTAGEKVLMKEAQVFSGVGVHKMILSKLDEAASFGTLINVIRQIDKRVSFVTTGQEVPEHLEVGRADRLAELVLGGPVHAGAAHN